MNRLEKIKILDDLFFEMEIHELFTEDKIEQARLKLLIERFGNFDRLRKARNDREFRRDWLRRARDGEITIEAIDGTTRQQNRLEYEIEKGNISENDFELMSFHF